MRAWTILMMWIAVASCDRPIITRVRNEVEPDWQAFRAVPAGDGVFQGVAGYGSAADRFSFRDLKREGDVSLARRLLGAVGERIAYIDRHKDRWQLYANDDAPVESVTLYSRPEAWGSAYGICRTEKYEIAFSADGSIDSVNVTPRFGVEGPIFQKDDFDWDHFYGAMCEKVPANHTPSYFPADDALEAQDLAIILSKAIFLAGQGGGLPFDLSCQSYNGSKCLSPREFLAKLKLNEIDKTSGINCLFQEKPGDHCYTVTVGEGRLGAFPKELTVRGTTHMNEWRVYSVSIREGNTIS